MMDKIIALYETGGKGKTATLNLLIDLLEVATTGCSMPTPHPRGKNRRKSFIYKGKKVSVATAGDNRWEIEQNCKFFDKEQCDIAFTASRKRSSSRAVLAIEEYAENKGVDINWVRKTIVSDAEQDDCNLKQAQELLNMI